MKDTIDPNTTFDETVKEHNRSFRQNVARQFTNGCTFDSVLKTCVRSGFASSWIGRSYGGITWNAVHSMDDSICVVIRHGDLDMTSLGWFHEASEFEGVMYNLTKAIVSEVEGLPYDDDFRERSGQSIKKTFSVVSVFPVTKKSYEETGQLASSVEYGKDKAINFLMEKMKSESVIILDDAVKTAISAFKHLCLQELEAEEYWVTSRDRHECRASHLPVPMIEKAFGSPSLTVDLTTVTLDAVARQTRRSKSVLLSLTLALVAVA